VTDEPNLPPNEPEGNDLERVRGFLDAAGREEAASPGPDGARPPAAPDRGGQNLSMDSYDRRLYEEARAATRRLGDMLAADDAPATLEPLARDLFAAFYKAQPDLLPEERVEESPLKANRPFLETLLEDPKTYETRATTALDELYSAAAATAATQEYLDRIADDPALVPPPPPSDRPSAADPTNDEPGDAGDDEPPEAPKGPSGRALRRAARAVADAALKDAEDLADALDSWGLEPADLKTVPLAERLDLAARLRGPDLRRLADLVGSMRNLQRAKAHEKVAAKRDEVHSVASGRPDDPARVLPSELSALASKSRVRRLDFLRRFVEGRVLHYELRRDEKKARGPVVALIDASSSMSGARMEWATAVGLALAAMATGRGSSGGRSCALVFFNARIVREVFFEGPDARDPKRLLQAATVGASGGTEYVAPIARGVEIAGGAVRACFSGADLVLVTDGECALPDPFLTTFLAEKERLSLSLHSVLIGRSGPLPELARYSDEVHALGPAMQGARDAASAIFERLA
jgi:uncharacterized protein with von Willebrand factor type A (vWA) domain